MRPVSARFLAAVAGGGSYRMISRVRVVTTGQNGVDPSDFVVPVLGSTAGELDEVDGKVTLDSTADVRSSLAITVPGRYWPNDAGDPLAPYGATELFIERGVVFGDGSREWVSQGYFRIDTPDQEDAPLGTIDIACPDRMQGIIDARIPYPLTYPVGEHVTAIIESLVSAVYPWAVFDFDAGLTSKTLASQAVTTDDRYKFLNDMITSYGMIWYWDYRGILVVKPPPNATDLVITIKGGRKGVLSTLSRTLSRQGVYSGVVASGEQLDDATPPVSALVVDDDPASPTYWFGPFGQIPQFFSSSFLTTPDQCTSAGQSLLIQSTGLPYSLDFGQVPNPALEPLDPVGISYPGRQEKHVLSQLVIPLKADALQTGQTRQLVKRQFQ